MIRDKVNISWNMHVDSACTYIDIILVHMLTCVFSMFTFVMSSSCTVHLLGLPWGLRPVLGHFVCLFSWTKAQNVSIGQASLEGLIINGYGKCDATNSSVAMVINGYGRHSSDSFAKVHKRSKWSIPLMWPICFDEKEPSDHSHQIQERKHTTWTRWPKYMHAMMCHCGQLQRWQRCFSGQYHYAYTGVGNKNICFVYAAITVLYVRIVVIWICIYRSTTWKGRLP